MNKKCLFLFCALFVVETNGDCAENFLKCFREFADSFFLNISEIEQVNATEQNLPDGFKQVKDVEIKTIQKISDSIQDELFKQLKQSVVNDVVVTDNPKTHIYVRTFSYNFGDDFFPHLENISLDSNEEQSEEVDHRDYESNKKGEIEEFSTEDRSTIPADTITDINRYNGDEKPTTTTENNKELVNNENSLPNNIFLTEEQKKSIENKSAILTETNASNKEKLQIENRASTTTQITDIIDKKHNKTEPIITSKASVSTLVEKPKIHKENKNNTSIINTKQEQNTTKTINSNENLQKLDKKESKTDIPAEKTNNNIDISNTNEPKTTDRSPTHTKKPTHKADKNLNNKQFEKDIRENLIQTDEENDYNIEDATDYPQIDYIDLYKDTTNEENKYEPTESPKTADIQDEIVENVEEYSLEIDTELENDTSTSICHGNTSDVSNIFPWIATIFIKNDTANNQFNYICDGALLSDKLLITAARCVNFFNSTVKPDDVLVFLGKRSLQIMGADEKNVRISKIIVHANFSNDEKVESDLALLLLEEPVKFTGAIRPACLGVNEELSGLSVTTAWDLSGALTPVFFEKNKNEDCDVQNADDSTFCATYGNEVALCPSYGGIYATKRAGRWYLHAIRSGDTADRGLCFTKDVLYTSLGDYQGWIIENMQ